jgi:transcriptional regulator with XRE-family HTH domain
MLNTVAARVRQVRRKAGLTQAELAYLLQVSRSAVAQWEAQEGSDPSSANLARLATALDCSFEWLATGRSARAFQRNSLHQSVDSAVQLRYFAHDDAEEHLLAAYRALDDLEKKAVTLLVDTLSRKPRKKHKLSL